MPRFQHNGEILDAIRYHPEHAGHIIHRLGEAGITCLHVHPTTEAIKIFAGGTSIAIQDKRHDFEGAEGLIYPGDWVVWHSFFDLEIAPSPIFEAEYLPLP